MGKMCEARLRGIVFDLDGTLVHSDYDWAAIRRTLGVDGSSIIDALNALPPEEQEKAWRRLEEIEEHAGLKARIAPGAVELLEFCRAREYALAIVTNNTSKNTDYLIRKHHLGAFDVVLTRDSGFYKPSGAPLVECGLRLGIAPGELMMVGDSDFDLRSAREAGYRWRVLLSAASVSTEAPQEFQLPGLRDLLGLLSEPAFSRVRVC